MPINACSRMRLAVLMAVVALVTLAAGVQVPCDSALQPSQQVISGSIDSAASMAVIDCDKDVPPPPGPLGAGLDFNDVVVAGYDSWQVEWIQNTGVGLGWVKRPNSKIADMRNARFVYAIATSTLSAVPSLVACNGYLGEQVGDFAHWCSHFVGDNSGNFAETVFASNMRRLLHVDHADVSGDSFSDVVTLEGPSLSPYGTSFRFTAFTDNGAGGYSTTKNVLGDSGSVPGLFGATTFALGDVTGDSQTDIVYGTYGGANLLAYLPWSSSLTFGAPVPILGSGVGLTLSVQVGDFDGDGDTDVVHCNAASELRWFENTAGDGTTWTARAFPFELPVSYMYVNDVDNDGDLDLVLSSQNVNNLFWVANRYDSGGAGRTKDEAWGVLRSIALCNGCGTVTMGDLDTDGDDDIVAAASFVDTVSGYLLNPLDPLQYSFVAAGLGAPGMIRPFDADGDGDTDVVAAIGSPDNGVFLFQNSDGLGGAWATPTRVGGPLFEPETAIAVDLDLDGDADVVASSATNSTLVYAVNNGGIFEISSWSGEISTSTAALVVAAVDVEIDGDMDLVGIDEPDAVFLVKNMFVETGTLSFGPVTTLYSNAGSDLVYMLVRDLNDDGYGDVVFSDTGTSSIKWLVNDNGGYPSPPLTLRTSAQQVGEFVLGDLTGDGLLDLVFHTRGTPNPFASKYSLSRANNVGSASSPVFLTPQPVDSQISLFVESDQTNVGLTIADIDGDNVMDIVVEGSFASVIVYFPGPTYAPRPVSVTNPDVSMRFVLSDFNLDGAVDFLIGLSSQIGWIPGLSIFSPELPRPGVTRTVQVAKCGYTMSCVAATLLEASGCATTTVVMPTGLYRGCFSAKLFPLFKSVTILGMDSTIDCSADGGGGLFDIREGAVVSLQDLTIIGAVSIPSDAESVAAIRVTGTGSSLALSDVTLRGCSNRLAEDRTVFQVNAGMGGAVLVELGASITALRTVFEQNVAGDSGGGLAVIGSASSVSLTDVTFDSNTATGSGGGLLILGSGSGSVAVTMSGVTLTNNVANGGTEGYGSGSGGGALLISESTTLVLDVDWSGGSSTISGNSASGAGGGLAVVGPAVDVTVDAPVVVSGNTGVWGGGVTVFATVDALPSPAASSSLAAAPAAGDVSGAAVFNGAMTMTDNSASYGGSLALCGVPVSLSAAASSSVSGSSASRSGGGVFVCLPAGTLPLADADNPPAARSIEDIPWLALGGGVLPSALFSGSVASGFGPIVASPPRTLAWSGSGARSLGPLDRATGFSLGTEAAVGLADVFGQTVIDAGIRLSMGVPLSAPGGVVLAGGDRSRLMDGAVVSFATVKALAVDSNALDGLSSVTYPLEVSVANAPTVAKVTLTVQIRSCGLGEGLVSPSGLPLECTVCSEGTFSNAVSLEACVACPVGAFNLKKGATSCESCPANAFRDVESNNATSAGSTVPCVCKVGFFALGYGKRGCAECVSGYFRLGERCLKCANTSELVLLLMVVAAFALVALLVYLNTRTSLSYKFAAAMIGLNSLQITAIYANLSLDWGKFAQTYFGIISFVNLNFDLASPECTSSSMDVYMFKWWTTMLLPVLFLVPFGVVGGVAAMIISMRNKKAEARALANESCEMDEASGSEPLTIGALKDAIVRSYYQLLVLLYLPLTSMALTYFGCRKERDGTWVLDTAPSRTCFNSPYWAVFPFAVVFFVIYCMAIPLGVFWLLRRKHSDASEGDGMGLVVFQLRYGFLVGRFRDEQYYFECNIMLRKFAVVFVTTFFFAAEAKANAAVFALAGSLVQLVLTQPYLAKFHNVLAVTCLTSCLAVLEGGTFRNGTMRALVVVTAILINILAIFVGNAIDLWRIRGKEAKADDEFYTTGTFRMASDASLVDDVARSREAEASMEMDTMLSIQGGAGSLQTVGTGPVGSARTDDLPTATSSAGAQSMMMSSDLSTMGYSSMIGSQQQPDSVMLTPPPPVPAQPASSTQPRRVSAAPIPAPPVPSVTAATPMPMPAAAAPARPAKKPQLPPARPSHKPQLPPSEVPAPASVPTPAPTPAPAPAPPPVRPARPARPGAAPSRPVRPSHINVNVEKEE
ncbi:uncharacterized protein AMSG_10669 [Thecamonas trahens ATCC 50062]|uniref:Tyrosine-protein kinase ephrin type A/B receptor-like domain-containing protein n=1 Tax=Thecamonas trahens ATCC 50062 TaxID=461836 RepID=A0A0L0DS85_THETB|nr:hypothetical protein AMSG_10669 [Thecamonas trahens ATCC 50062]KNC55072.1 hypothetical protein AMSG_10669 [Thecamonas trahens ATCC 50062]|eukprot:XP_013753375.1 hypothetical protein AMSG_10669 [Thecamonas trahens ATCC 50062]